MEEYKISDIFTKEKRSSIMSKIKSKGSKMELKFKQALEDNNIYYTYQPIMFGKPDFLIHPNIIVFCDSSFWHGRDWDKLKSKLSKKYWYGHIKSNILRDSKVNVELEKMGFFVLRFWDSQIEKDINKCIYKIIKIKKLK